jgi:hypothetical protein
LLILFALYINTTDISSSYSKIKPGLPINTSSSSLGLPILVMGSFIAMVYKTGTERGAGYKLAPECVHKTDKFIH